MATTPKSKHERIFCELYDSIVAGEYATGQQIPTEAELALRFGASRPTVARALRDLEQRGYLLRRRGVGSFVTQRDHTKTRLFGIVMPRPGEGIFAPMCDAIVRGAEGNGYAVLLAGTPVIDAKAVAAWSDAFCEQVIARKVVGVFFGPLDLPDEMFSFNHEIARRLAAAGIAVVLLDRDVVDYPSRSNFDLVGIDNRRQSMRITQHLLQLGCRTIHYVSHTALVSTATARLTGYRDAMTLAGITPRPEWIHHWDLHDRDFVQNLMDRHRPEACVCVNDLLASTLMHSLAVLGVRVPDDVRIVGFDDIPLARHLPVQLTTIRQPAQEIGAVAVRVMLERVANPGSPARDLLLACDLVVRESCGARMTAPIAAD